MDQLPEHVLTVVGSESEAKPVVTPPKFGASTGTGPLAAWMDPTHPPLDTDKIGQDLRSMSCREDPVHLHSIARHLRVQRIAVSSELPCPGQVQWNEDGPTIWLSAGLPTNRRRFTLAHELAHVMMGHGRWQPEVGALDSERVRDEERIADLVASATLIPEIDVARLRALDDITLADVRAVADSRQVSLSAVVTRLDARSRPTFLLGLRERGNEWLTTYFVGRVKGLPTTLSVPPDEGARVSRLGSLDQQISLRATMNGQEYQLEGTGNRRGTMTLILVTRVHHLASRF